MTHDWRDLCSPYFEEVCRDVWNELLAVEGFAPPEVTSTGAVRVRNGTCILAFSEYVEDTPPSLMLSLSLDELGAHPFPLWSVVAEGSWPRQGFTFSSKDELGLALRKLVSELLLTDAKHWFTDAQALRAQGDTFHAKAVAAHEAAALAHDVQQLRAVAEAAFQAKDYPSALEAYAKVGDALTPVERKRMEYMNKKL
jgi:tetratricopeptide (TPR) repeat protein